MQGLVVIAQPLGSKGSVKGQVGTVTLVYPLSLLAGLASVVQGGVR
jgi:hypothetical protein